MPSNVLLPLIEYSKLHCLKLHESKTVRFNKLFVKLQLEKIEPVNPVFVKFDFVK